MRKLKQKKKQRPVPKFKGSTEEETRETAGLPGETKKSRKTGNKSGEVTYTPPEPEEAPEEIRQVVMYGQDILTNTKKEIPENVGNELNCHNCHFKGGITKGGKNGGISYVGVAAKYPKYRDRQNYSVDLPGRVNNCLMRSLKGKPLPPESREMIAVITYLQWISKNIPIYAEIPWLGLKPLESNHTPNKESGKQVFAEVCSKCHGINGQGGMHAKKMSDEGHHKKDNGQHNENGPPLWGNQSFTDGAGMSEQKKLAPFAYDNMPRHNPTLSEEQALDVAAFVTDQPRPHFEEDKKTW